MTEETTRGEPVPASIRAVVAGDLSPVQPLRPPIARALAILPLAAVLLVAPPLLFSFRDLQALGLTWSWGASLAQVALGVALIAAALREAVPGRAWSRLACVALVSVPFMFVAVVTFVSWSADPVRLRTHWWPVAGICLTGSFLAAFPAVLVATSLALRAFPTRPWMTGALGGLGAGLLADAGWRLFCHYSEPAHVLLTHLGGVAVAAIFGAGLLAWRQKP